MFSRAFAADNLANNIVRGNGRRKAAAVKTAKLRAMLAPDTKRMMAATASADGTRSPKFSVEVQRQQRPGREAFPAFPAYRKECRKPSVSTLAAYTIAALSGQQRCPKWYACERDRVFAPPAVDRGSRSHQDTRGGVVPPGVHRTLSLLPLSEHHGRSTDAVR